MRPRRWLVLFGFLLPLVAAETASARTFNTLPPGTNLNIRTTRPIFADNVRRGSIVPGVVDRSVRRDGRVIIPSGASARLAVTGVERSSNVQGRNRVWLRVESVRFNGRSHPISTDQVQLRGRNESSRTGRSVARGTGAGAVTGGLIGGGTGAAIGATAGAGAGMVAGSSGRSRMTVPAETLVRFQTKGTTRIVAR